MTVYINRAASAPVELKVFQGTKMKFQVHYVSYEIGRPFDASLFEPPKDVHFDDKTQ